MSFKKLVQRYYFFTKYANISVNNFDISTFFYNFAAKNFVNSAPVAKKNGYAIQRI